MQAAAQNLRDILTLAHLLRRFAEEHLVEDNQDLFVSTAAALETRAHAMAETPAGATLARDGLYAPVNRLV